MKIFLIIFLTAITHMAIAQDNILKKGNAVYVQQTSANSDIKDYTSDLINALNNWGYWKIASTKEQADFILDMHVDSRRGITATSWGGQTIITNAALLSKDGKKLWQSENYEVSPNGTNGFNAGRACVKKLVRKLGKEFK